MCETSIVSFKGICEVTGKERIVRWRVPEALNLLVNSLNGGTRNDTVVFEQQTLRTTIP